MKDLLERRMLVKVCLGSEKQIFSRVMSPRSATSHFVGAPSGHHSRLVLCMLVFTLSRPPPTWKVKKRLQLLFQSRTGRNVPATSIYIGSYLTDGFSSCLGAGFMLPALKNVFPANLDFHWYPVDQWDLEAGGPPVRTPDGRLLMHPAD